MTDLNKAFQDGEWDTDNIPPKPTAPVVLRWLWALPIFQFGSMNVFPNHRANIYKSELREAEGMKVKLENKDLDIKELKLMLRSKGKLAIFTCSLS